MHNRNINGRTLLVRIVKTMYAFIQSAALWYDAVLTNILIKKLGFVPNSHDTV